MDKYDLVIKNGKVVDVENKEIKFKNIGIIGNKIIKVTSNDIK
jgi:N-acyl-D-amino-acid deacylase